MRINEFHWIKIWPFAKFHLNQHFGFSLDNPAQRFPLIMFELKLQRFSLQVTIFWLDNGLVFTWQSCQATCLWHLAPSVPGPKEPEKLLIVQLWSYGFFIVQLWSNAFLLLSNSDLMLIKPALLVPRRRLQAQAVCAGSAGCPASPADFDSWWWWCCWEWLESIILFSCPEQLNMWPCPLLCLSVTTNNQSLHNTTEWP